MPVIQAQVQGIADVSLFLLLRAFSSGCTALTGVEAISNGVLAFRKPEADNAKKTLTVMAIIITILVFGISFLSFQLHVHPEHDRTLVSLIAENIFGRTFFYFLIQAATMMILFLAANTSFADFPRLCYFHARDGFMPRQFTQLGDRLVFTHGIIFLAFFSSLLIVLFQGSVHMLIPMYAVGVFTSFTLSQAGMVKHHLKHKKGNWVRSIIVNGLGFVMTLIVLIVVIITKFTHGAWVILILVVFFNFLFKAIKKHYINVAEQLSVEEHKYPLKIKKEKHLMLVLVPSFHKGIVQALTMAKNLCKNVKGLHVNISKRDKDRIIEKWDKYVPGTELVILDSPYRVLSGRLKEYLDEIESKDKNLCVTVVISEFVPTKWWQFLLHNQTALAIKTMIHFRPRTNYISVQYHLKK
ncbi:MAG: amino acid permease [Nanoarchaeota archaeon]|nr:amino acid permease [Nanoarchaeota archaeon]